MFKSPATLILCVIMLLSGCAQAYQKHHEIDLRLEDTDQQTPSQTIPENAILSDSGQYMIPLEKPVDDCKAYRPLARGQMVIQVIYFKHAGNKFSPISEGALCE